MNGRVSFGCRLATLLALLETACGTGAVPVWARTYRLAEVPRHSEDPMWVELLPGDEIPLWVKEGANGEPRSQATRFRVRRKFYLLYDHNQVRLSYDKQNFVEPAAKVSVLFGDIGDQGGRLGFQLTVPPDNRP